MIVVKRPNESKNLAKNQKTNRSVQKSIEKSHVTKIDAMFKNWKMWQMKLPKVTQTRTLLRGRRQTRPIREKGKGIEIRLKTRPKKPRPTIRLDSNFLLPQFHCESFFISFQNVISRQF